LKKQNVNKRPSKRYSKKKDISAIEKTVDKILFENKDRLLPTVDNGGIKRQNRFDQKKFSLDERKKESIYFVKVKKNSDEKKVKQAGKKPTVVDKKDGVNPGMNKKSQEKKSVPLVDSSGKNASSSSKPIANLRPDNAKWLEKRLHKFYHKKGKKSSDKDSSKSNRHVKGNEHKKIISSLAKPSSKHTFKINETTISVKHNQPDQGRIKALQINVDNALVDGTEKKSIESFQLGEYDITTARRRKKQKTKNLVKEDLKKQEISKKPTTAEKKKEKIDTAEITANNVEKEKTDIWESKISFIEKSEEPSKGIPVKGEYTNENPSSSVKEIAIEGITPDGQIQFFKEADNLKSITLKSLGYSKSNWEELDFYPLNEPFAYVEIVREKASLDKRYVLVEIELSEDEIYVLNFMKETLSGSSVNTTDLESKGEESFLLDRIDQIIDDYIFFEKEVSWP